MLAHGQTVRVTAPCVARAREPGIPEIPTLVIRIENRGIRIVFGARSPRLDDCRRNDER